MNQAQAFNRFAQFFTFIFVLAMFLPRVVGQGMFADGFCYSSMARNMAEGRGWFWEPFFSTSFWLPYNSGTVYYENMPLMFWLQSWFFKLFGDHWWVEKIYCTVMVLACYWAIRLIFKKVSVGEDTDRGEEENIEYRTPNVECRNTHPWSVSSPTEISWLPVLLWYLVPIILWAGSNNQMDYTMAFFSMIAVYFVPLPSPTPRSVSSPTEISLPVVSVLTNRFSGTTYQCLLAGFFTFLAFLAKGPVGIFPLAVPIIHWVAFRNYAFSKALMNNLLVILGFSISMLLLWQYAPAQHYIKQFLEQQLFSAISGKRELASDGFARLYILKQLLIQNAPMAGLGLIFMFLSKTISAFKVSKNALFMLLVALSASLPIMISPKQHEIYLIPAMPFYALAGAFFLLPSVQVAITRLRWNVGKYHNALWVLLLGVLVYSATLIGKPSREKDVLADMQQLSPYIPEGSKVGVCQDMMSDFVIHCYLQRYHKWELTTDFNQTNYVLSQPNCEGELEGKLVGTGFKKVDIVGERFGFYRR